MTTALFIRHRAVAGRRDDLHGVWLRHLQPAISANPGHDAYFYCFDDEDPDVVVVYQQYRDADAAAAFLATTAYRDYFDESAPLLAEAPVLTRATPRWQRDNLGAR
jgi:quinol monooxygenase YgiN